MFDFVYEASPSRVIFGHGTIKRLPDELQKLGFAKPLLLCTPQQIDQAKMLQDIIEKASVLVAGTYAKATMHTPTNVTEDAMSFVATVSADCVISIGGGSTIGLGKAISIRTGLHHICIPTTYAGSEMTPILGETDQGRKTTRSDPAIRPKTVIYDVDLTLTLPVSLSSTSGVNAIAHAIEALYAKNGNPVVSLFALEGVKSLADALPKLLADPLSRDGREKALYGAWLCGICLGSTSMALHHKICHTLGGSFNLPHAETHTVVLPHAVAYNAPAIPEAMVKLADALPNSDGDAIKGLNVLLDSLNVKRALKDFGMPEDGIDKATEIAMTSQYANPRALEAENLRELIRRCWAGEAARADL